MFIEVLVLVPLVVIESKVQGKNKGSYFWRRWRSDDDDGH
jgi:hypothetical protein